MTCGGLVPKKNFCFRLVSVEFHTCHQCFCRDGVVQQHRKYASIVECQSSVLCDLQVIVCMAPSLGTPVGTSRVFLYDQWCLLRSVLLVRRSCMIDSKRISSGGKNRESTSGAPLWPSSVSHVLRFFACVKTTFKSHLV